MGTESDMYREVADAVAGVPAMAALPEVLPRPSCCFSRRSSRYGGACFRGRSLFEGARSALSTTQDGEHASCEDAAGAPEVDGGLNRSNSSGGSTTQLHLGSGSNNDRREKGGFENRSSYLIVWDSLPCIGARP